MQQNIKMNEMQVTTHIKTTDNDERLLEEQPVWKSIHTSLPSKSILRTHTILQDTCV